MILLVAAPVTAKSDAFEANTVELTPSENNHVAELNSNQPYVAGYHVETSDLYTRERVNATAITVSFPSTDTSYFPSNGWLGAGMFVQGQDSELGYVDYAYYTMLVIDSSGNFFVDIGLHQTRGSIPPLQMPTEELSYAYTWKISGFDPATPATLTALWDTNGHLQYSFSTDNTNTTLKSIEVASLPNCESVISKFYAGTTFAAGSFPLGHYVYFFQFGVISNEIIRDNHWSAHLAKPRILRKIEWNNVETAFTIQGDISYLDEDWMWGGAPYEGVSAQYHQNPLRDPYEVVFSHTGHSLPSGTILWESTKTSDVAMVPPTVFNQPVSLNTISVVVLELALLVVVAVGAIRYGRSQRMVPNRIP
jgi:hypothetical protein